jgi:Zn-dependent protease
VVFRVLDMAGIGGFALELSLWIVFFNLVLAFFNLLPIPPLDGYNALLAFLPPKAAFTVQRWAPYGIIVILLLVFIPGSPLGLLFDLVRLLTGILIGA